MIRIQIYIFILISINVGKFFFFFSFFISFFCYFEVSVFFLTFDSFLFFRYHKGIDGLTKNIDETVLYLNSIIKQSNYKKILFMGVSAGGYASILFGSLCNASSVIAFIPRTKLNNAIDKKYQDLKTILNNQTEYILHGDTNVQDKNNNHHISQCNCLDCFQNVKIIYHRGLNMKKLRDNGTIKKNIDNILNYRTLIFIHFRKCGGTSLVRAFKKVARRSSHIHFPCTHRNGNAWENNTLVRYWLDDQPLPTKFKSLKLTDGLHDNKTKNEKTEMSKMKYNYCNNMNTNYNFYTWEWGSCFNRFNDQKYESIIMLREPWSRFISEFFYYPDDATSARFYYSNNNNNNNNNSQNENELLPLTKGKYKAKRACIA